MGLQTKERPDSKGGQDRSPHADPRRCHGTADNSMPRAHEVNSRPPDSEPIPENGESVDQTKDARVVRSMRRPQKASATGRGLLPRSPRPWLRLKDAAPLPPGSEPIPENGESVDQRKNARVVRRMRRPQKASATGTVLLPRSPRPWLRLKDAAPLPPSSEPIPENGESVDQRRNAPALPASAADEGEAHRDAFRRWMDVCLPGVNGLPPESEGPAFPPDSEPMAESGETVTQKDRDRVKRLAAELVARGRLFMRQGTVVATWRQYKGRRLGPYYRLAYREAGRQKSIYLGASAWVAAQVRGLLGKLQTPLRESRVLQHAKAMIRASLRAHQARAKSLFLHLGVRLKGFEYRGFARHLREVIRLRDALAHDRRTAAAWRVITGAEQGGSRSVEVGSGTVSRGSPNASQSAA